MRGAMNVRAVGALHILALCLGAGLIGGCSTLPSLENRRTSTALFDTGDTKLGRAIAPMVDAHPGVSGIYPLPDARDAFAARALLAQSAERTLDVQYYIWRSDLSGTLLFEALRSAADRGVRVRLLLDDNDTSGLDTLLASLASHSNIEVRLFNPFAIREPRWIGYVTDFFRLNRRMHNKSFTADNQATIIGGRNVGDEYFGAIDGVVFVDLDVMAVGPVVAEVSKQFDRYWASGSSYPVERLLPAGNPAAIAEITSSALRIERDPAAVAYMNALRNLDFVHEMDQGSLVLDWSATRMISDDPGKGLGLAVEAGVALYELRRLSPDTAPRQGAGPLGSSGSSLHAKVFSVDNSRVFIGSFNFDPRSSTLNTEMGFVIDSPALANRMEVALSRRFLASAYEVRLSDAGKLYWIERREGEWVRHDTEPGTTFWQRLEIWLMSMLPIEWLL